MEMRSLWDIRFKDYADPQPSACPVVGSQSMVAIMTSSHFQGLICSWGYLRPRVKISNGQKSCNTTFQKSLPLVSRFLIANDWFSFAVSLGPPLVGMELSNHCQPTQHPAVVVKCSFHRSVCVLRGPIVQQSSFTGCVCPSVSFWFQCSFSLSWVGFLVRETLPNTLAATGSPFSEHITALPLPLTEH